MKLVQCKRTRVSSQGAFARVQLRVFLVTTLGPRFVKASESYGRSSDKAGQAPFRGSLVGLSVRFGRDLSVASPRERWKVFFFLLSRNSRYVLGFSVHVAVSFSRSLSLLPFLVPTATSGCQECLTRGMASRGVGRDRRLKARSQ